MKKLLFLLLCVSSIFAQTRVSTLAGTTSGNYVENIGYLDGSPAMFNQPTAITVLPNGNVYTLDIEVPAIRQILPNGFTSLFSGNKDFVSPSYVGHGNINGSISQARFNNPTGLASDNQSNIYVADWGNKSIRKITNGTVSTIVSGLISPKCLCLDSNGNMYIGDGSRVVRATQSGVITVVATGFNEITGITIDNSNNVYVADGLVKRINLSNNSVSAVNIVGLTFAYDVKWSTNLYVSDSGGNVIYKDGVVFAGNGLPRFRDGLVGPTRFSASFYNQRAIAVLNGKVYVADTNNHRIRIVTP